MPVNIIFERANRSHWLSVIIQSMETLRDIDKEQDLEIYFNSKISIENIQPWHLVTLACLMDYAFKNVKCPKINISGGDQLIDFLRNDLHLAQYFAGTSHIEAVSNEILNLWNVKVGEALIYSARLSKYLKQRYFQKKDLSLMQTMLDELYANIADHSHSDGVAYSFIKYFEDRETIEAAFCDFGVGIPQSLKNHGHKPQIKEGYVKYATRQGVSVKSNEHNAGLGLTTVLECMEGSRHYLRIISNDEFYYHSNFQGNLIEKTFRLNKPFPGTLIYFSLDVSQFQSDEYLGLGDLINEEDW